MYKNLGGFGRAGLESAWHWPNSFNETGLSELDGSGGFFHFAEFGADLDFDLGEDDLPIVKALRGRASAVVGRNVAGYQLGVSFGF